MALAVPKRAMDITSNVTYSGLNVPGDNNTIYYNCTVNKPSTHCKDSKQALKKRKTCDNRSNIFRGNFNHSWVTGGRERCTEDSIKHRSSEYDDFIKKAESEYDYRDFITLLGRKLIKQDLQWTAEQLVGEVSAVATDNAYSHFEVPEEDVEDIRKNLRNETSVENEVYKVLKRSLRERNREYLLRKLFELDENLARGFIEYLLEEMRNESSRGAGTRDEEQARQSPPRCTQNKIKDNTPIS